MARTFWGLIACVLVAALSLVVQPALAAGSMTYSQAMAQCQADIAKAPVPANNTCYNKPNPNGDGGSVVWSAVWDHNSIINTYPYIGGVPNGCNGIDSQSGAFKGNLAAGSPMCQAQPDGSGCGMTFTPDSNPFLNRAGTSWATHGTYKPTGSTCTPGPIGGDPSSAPAPPAAPAKTCGGGSCCDTASSQCCAVDGSGAQVCVPLKTAQTAPGGCVSSGATTICAGTPSAPTPPAPPASPISDPPSEIKSSDQYTSAGPNGNQTSNVNVYGAGNSKPGSGQKPGDDGPASSSSSGGNGDKGDGTSAGGGGDCSSPPMVEGSPALGMIARQTWLLRCADAGQGSDDSDKSVPGLDDIPEKPADGTFKEVSVLDKIDQSGFGGGTQCPSLPSVDLGPFGHMDMNSDWWCEFLERLGWAVLFTGAWLALRILGER